MLIELVNNNVIDKIYDILLYKKNKIAVFGSIDDDFVKEFDKFKIFNKIYLSLDKKMLTKESIENIFEDNVNLYVHDNNIIENTEKSNYIFCEDNDNNIEILIGTFEFTKNNLLNSKSFCIYIKFNKNEGECKNLLALYNSYVNDNGNYKLFSNDLISKIESDKGFRNSKAYTLDEELSKDEIIKSFRTINNYDDKDEFLKMIEINNKIKKNNFSKDEVMYDDKSDNNEVNKLDVDIEFDL